MEWKVPMFRIYWDEDDKKALQAVLERGSLWAEGPEIKEFETALEKYLGAKHVVAFNSGTSALHSVLLDLGMQGKEVIVPSFTFISTANAVVLAGAKPVFAEVEGQTYGLDAADVEKRINENTGAILPVHYSGIPARDLEKLKELADKYRIPLIEDAAESFGATKNGRMTGTFGKAGMFSFCQNKVVTAGEGGAISTEDELLAEKLKMLRSHGRIQENYFSSVAMDDYALAGFNYRMPSMLAALGLSQLKKTEKLIEMRRKNAALYAKGLAGIKGIKVPSELPGSRNVYQIYTIEVEGEGNRDKLQLHLAENGIMSRVYFGPVHLKTAYKELGWKEGQLPFTEALSKRVLTLPFYAGVKKGEIEMVVEGIKSFFREKRN